MINIIINNPPKGINENQSFINEEHLNEWLESHKTKLPNSFIEDGVVYYQEATKKNLNLPPLENNYKIVYKTPEIPQINTEKSEIILQKPKINLTLWQRFTIFVRNLFYGKNTD